MEHRPRISLFLVHEQGLNVSRAWICITSISNIPSLVALGGVDEWFAVVVMRERSECTGKKAQWLRSLGTL